MYPVFFQIGSFSIYSSGLFSMLGFMAGIYFLIKITRRSKLSINFLNDHFWKFIFSILIGGRLLFVLNNLDIFKASPMSTLNILEGGFNFSGSALGFKIMLFYLCFKHGEKFFKWLDVSVLAGFLSFAFMDIGCFLDGCNYGQPTKLPWGITFENIDLPYSIPLHPTQLYSFIFHASIVTILYRWWMTKPKKGQTGLIGIMTASIFYLGNDFLQGDIEHLFFNILRINQIFYIILFLVCFFVLLQYERFHPGHNIPQTKLRRKQL